MTTKMRNAKSPFLRGQEHVAYEERLFVRSRGAFEPMLEKALQETHYVALKSPGYGVSELRERVEWLIGHNNRDCGCLGRPRKQ